MTDARWTVPPAKMGAISDTLPEQRSKEGALGKPVRCVTWARLIANVAVALALISCIGLLLYEDTSVAMIVQFSSGHRGGTVMRSQIQTARRCSRVDLPSQFANSTQGPYNPAGVRSPQTGEWLLFFTLDEVWFGISNYTQDGTYLEGRMRSHPLLARMGNDRLPAQTHQEPVTMLDLDESYSLKAQAEGSDVYKAADWRPFVWRNQVFLGHWMAYQPAQERMALSYLNLTAGKVELVHRFSTLSSEIEQTAAPLEPPAKLTLRRSLRLLGNTALEQPAFRREKNWGFFEENGALLVSYALLPCTVILEFVPAEPDNLKLRSRHCYDTEAAAILQTSGLDILNEHVHMSGNPVPYDIQNGDLHQEYIALVHIKHPEYINWAVRISRATKRITHVSAGPILRNQEFRNEGFLKTALVVSSFHVLPKPDQARGPADNTLRIYYGEGDRYGCALDTDTRSIAWHQLRSTERA